MVLVLGFGVGEGFVFVQAIHLFSFKGVSVFGLGDDGRSDRTKEKGK